MLRNRAWKARVRILAAVAIAATVTAVPTVITAPGASAAGFFQWINSGSNYCMDVANNVTYGTANQWACSPLPADEQWRWGSELFSSTYYQLIDDQGACLGLSNVNAALGDVVITEPCGGQTHPDQYWRTPQICLTNPRSFAIFNYVSSSRAQSYVVAPAGGSLNEGAQLTLQNDQNICNTQFWYGQASPGL